MALSKEQSKVIDELSSGLFVWTNEGSHLRAWVGKDNSEKVRGLKVRTVEVLHDKNKIQLVGGDYPAGLYKYKLK